MVETDGQSLPETNSEFAPENRPNLPQTIELWYLVVEKISNVMHVRVLRKAGTPVSWDPCGSGD